MTVAALTRTDDQRMNALRIANEVRTARVATKRSLTGPHHASTLLITIPDHIRTMRVRELLLAIPKWGTTRVDRALRQAQISPLKTIGGLTDRQTVALVHILRDTDKTGPVFLCPNCQREWPEPFCDECGRHLPIKEKP